MVPIGESYLEKLNNNTFQLSKPTVVWHFTKEQLEAEIAKLQTQLMEKQQLLEQVNNLGY
jgi:hypothetical protein